MTCCRRVHSTVGLFQVMPRTLREFGPSSLKPKDEGSASKHSSSNSRPLSRQLFRRDSKSWFRYLTACELVPTPCALSRLCRSLSAMPGMFEELYRVVDAVSVRGSGFLCVVLLPSVSTPRCRLCLGFHLAPRHLLHLSPVTDRSGKERSTLDMLCYICLGIVVKQY